jgi:hypothetical protein
LVAFILYFYRTKIDRNETELKQHARQSYSYAGAREIAPAPTSMDLFGRDRQNRRRARERRNRFSSSFERAFPGAGGLFVRLSDPGARVLNCFAYTGGFGIAAMMGKAREVINLDTSEAALDLARATFSLNGLDGSRAEFLRADVFQLLRAFRDAKEKFDTIILDPPKLFQKIVADAALDAGRDAQILRFLRQAPDHPVSIHFPEGLYLKGLALRVL